MRITVCEDTVQDMEKILDLCDAYGEKEGYRIDTLSYADAAKMLGDPQASEADIMLLDIMMPGESSPAPAGIAAARKLRARGYKGAIIFTTSSLDYYPEGFEVGALHYLVKPLSYNAFAQAMDRALQYVKRPERMITVPVNRLQLTIPRDAIRYAEVYGRETLLYTTAEKLRVLLPLKQIEALLDGDPFLRCYRSYIINMDYVRSMDENHFVLDDGVSIPISQRTKQAFKEHYLSYKLGKVRQEEG